MAKTANKTAKVHKHHYKLKIKKSDLKLRANFYQIMHNIPKNSRCAVIPYLSDTAVNYLCEAVFNTVKTDIGLPKKQRHLLRKELNCCKSKISSLCSDKVPLKSKRKIFTQKGGFLGVLLRSILPIVTSLISPSE